MCTASREGSYSVPTTAFKQVLLESVWQALPVPKCYVGVCIASGWLSCFDHVVPSSISQEPPTRASKAQAYSAIG